MVLSKPCNQDTIHPVILQMLSMCKWMKNGYFKFHFYALIFCAWHPASRSLHEELKCQYCATPMHYSLSVSCNCMQIFTSKTLLVTVLSLYCQLPLESWKSPWIPFMIPSFESLPKRLVSMDHAPPRYVDGLRLNPH